MSDPQRTVHIAGPDAGGQAIFAVVGQRNGFRLVLEDLQGQNRAEGLLLHDKANVSRIEQMVEAAIAAGAKTIVRGGPFTEGPLAKGAFFRPALLEVSDPKLDIDWAKVYDSTEEGGFKQSGLGRMNGLAVLDDFIAHKHIALKPGVLAR